MYDRPSLFYGWTEKNTRPKIKSNEKRKRHKVHGLLSVDAISGEEYLQLKSKAKSVETHSLQSKQSPFKTMADGAMRRSPSGVYDAP